MKITFAIGSYHCVRINPKTDATDRLILAYFATAHRQHARVHKAIGIALSRRIRAHQRSARTAA